VDQQFSDPVDEEDLPGTSAAAILLLLAMAAVVVAGLIVLALQAAG
jgi:hypothetical protein